jgi:hypothetical protein
VSLVIGAFSTLAEAEKAAEALLHAGLPESAISAVARSGAGRLMLAGRVPVAGVGEPVRLANRTERIGASALLGAVAGALVTALALFLLSQLGLDPFAPARGWLPAALVPAIEVILGALVAAGVGALLRRTQGLPHELAIRYAMRLDQGDTVIAVRRANGADARSVQELLASNGAILAHVTDGTLEPLGEPPTPSVATSQAAPGVGGQGSGIN